MVKVAAGLLVVAVIILVVYYLGVAAYQSHINDIDLRIAHMFPRLMKLYGPAAVMDIPPTSYDNGWAFYRGMSLANHHKKINSGDLKKMRVEAIERRSVAFDTSGRMVFDALKRSDVEPFPQSTEKHLGLWVRV